MNGHALDESTRVVYENGLVGCKICMATARSRYYRGKQRQKHQERAARGEMSVSEAATALGIRASTIHHWRARGLIVGRQERGRWFVRLADIAPLLPDPEEELRPRDAAQLLGVSRQRVSQLVRAGHLAIRMRGTGVFVLRSSVLARLRAQAEAVATPTPPPA